MNKPLIRLGNVEVRMIDDLTPEYRLNVSICAEDVTNLIPEYVLKYERNKKVLYKFVVVSTDKLVVQRAEVYCQIQVNNRKIKQLEQRRIRLNNKCLDLLQKS